MEKPPKNFIRREKIKRIRKAKKLSLTDLATDCTCDAATIWRLENIENCSPQVYIIAKIAVRFKMNITELIDMDSIKFEYSGE